MRTKLFLSIFLGQLLILICLIGGLGLSFYSEVISILKKHDMSMQKNVRCNNDKPIWLVSFANGEAHVSNQKVLVNSSLNKCVNHSLQYSMKDIDTSYYLKHREILDEPRGAGYWLWKPYFILKSLELIPENDYLLYVDSGAIIKTPIDTLIKDLSGHSMLFFENWHDNKSYIKRDTLRYFKLDNDSTRNKRQLMATFFLIKNDINSRKFISEWLRVSENKSIIDDSKSKEEYPEFIDHRHDQATLSLLYYKNPPNIKILSTHQTADFFISHRRRIADKTLMFIEEESSMRGMNKTQKYIAKCISRSN